MRRFLQALIVSSVLSVTHISLATAQSLAGGSFDVSANGGITNLEGIDQKKGHGAFGFAGGFNLTKHLMIGAEYNYLLLGSLNVGGATANEDVQMYGVVARFPLIDTRFVVPYGVLGGGGDRLHASATGDLASASASESGGYFSAGGGVSVYLYHGLGLRPEFRYDRLEFGSTSIDGIFASGGSQNEYRGTVALFYQFGRR